MKFAIRKALLTRYGISPVSALRQDQIGVVNQSWYVGNDLVITVFSQRPLPQVELICRVVENDCSGLLPKIVASDKGPVSMIRGQAAVMWRRTRGEHFVGPDHSEKASIPGSAHRSVAEAFWRLHESLAGQRTAARELGQMNYALPGAQDHASISFSNLPIFLKRDYIAQYLKAPMLTLRYPALVHHDFERQNVLHAPDGQVTGVVDTDSLRLGDLLFEYVHCMMNFLFTDPDYQPGYADDYIEALKKAGMINEADLALVPNLMKSFAARDLVNYLQFDLPPRTDLARLAAIYDQGLGRVHAYFSS